MDFHINYGSNNNKENEEKLTSIVQAVDQNYIPRKSYRALASIESNLEREWAVSNQRHKITRNINQKIPITLINIPTNLTQNESVFEDNLNTFSVGITEPLQNIKNGDSRNVERKIKHVMITMAILDDEQNINKSDYHYTIVLYPGIENYEILEVMMAPFIQELDELKNNGLTINGIIWNFELYFSSDWKFLSICLVPLDNWVPDELHIMLRIWDQLWSLVLAKLKEYNQFDNICRDEIIQEMNRIGVNFQFWQDRGANTWSYSSLMGDDKFNQIYLNIKLKNYDSQQFQFEGEDWLELFLTPDRLLPNSTHTEKGLYKLSEITPYIHVLVCHMSEFMEKHKRWSIKAFSCAPVEKKNHQQVTNFFRQTFKDGGDQQKSAIIEILEFENRMLFYLFDNVKPFISKPKRICSSLDLFGTTGFSGYLDAWEFGGFFLQSHRLQLRFLGITSALLEHGFSYFRVFEIELFHIISTIFQVFRHWVSADAFFGYLDMGYRVDKKETIFCLNSALELDFLLSNSVFGFLTWILGFFHLFL
ncbi:hypothetical protein RhiirA1_470515 [Rhizophagus irregularis]|uniref:Uncharacterized protein n=1 Tax=Rhizophagus irregularis TaxID=588596 RepID=A0A2N0R609_9GLOM|nr:hypothetical protein RhiirA1_470515 [Rhizophagus irregularis]